MNELQIKIKGFCPSLYKLVELKKDKDTLFPIIYLNNFQLGLF